MQYGAFIHNHLPMVRVLGLFTLLKDSKYQRQGTSLHMHDDSFTFGMGRLEKFPMTLNG